jgi:hypothetical protein
MVEIIEPFDGVVFDPACGSGGMFVQSARFVEENRGRKKAADLLVYGQEKTLATVHLAKMNLAVNGLRGDIKQANGYYEDPYGSFGKFDYVLANPPFNVDDVNLSKVESDKRFNTYGVPRNKTDAKKKDKGEVTVPNANYLWISLFATSLKDKGRAALVMANSASDARNSEAEIRKQLVEGGLISGMLSLSSNMFYTVTLPATLWFFDKGKTDGKILFVDAGNVFTQIDRAHREFSEEQIRDLAVISHLRRGERCDFTRLVHSYFERGFALLAENRVGSRDLSLPALPTQRKIAAILSAYDDLIEVNERRIALLEKMAEEIYREWFVRKRFPEHEKIMLIKGIPETWRICTISNIAQRIITGKTPPTDQQEYFNGKTPFIKTPDMHDQFYITVTEETLSSRGAEYQKKQTIPAGSICISCIGTGGIVSITSQESQTNQQINSIIPINLSYLEWVFFCLRDQKETIQLFGGTGSTMTNLSKGKLENLPIIKPDERIISDFHNTAEPLFNEIYHLLQTNCTLRSTRDHLLTRLMSGVLDVEKLDIAFPPSMEEELKTENAEYKRE